MAVAADGTSFDELMESLSIGPQSKAPRAVSFRRCIRVLTSSGRIRLQRGKYFVIDPYESQSDRIKRLGQEKDLDASQETTYPLPPALIFPALNITGRPNVAAIAEIKEGEISAKVSQGSGENKETITLDHQAFRMLMTWMLEVSSQNHGGEMS